MDRVAIAAVGRAWAHVGPCRAGVKLSAKAPLLLVLACALVGCTGLFYQPSRRVLGRSFVPYQDVWFEAEDRTALHGWWFPATDGRQSRGLVLQFHGNAGNLTSHFLSLVWVTLHGWDFLAFDYRGYGASGGSPSPDGLQRDGVAAIRWAIGKVGSRGPVVLHGQSLGGAVLADAFTRLTPKETGAVAGVVIEGSFHSYPEVAASVAWRRPILFPFTGIAYCCVSDDHDPAPSLSRIAPVPLLVIHGEKDEVIPIEFGKVIYELAREPRELWIVPGAGHLRPLDVPFVRRSLIAWMESSAEAWAERRDRTLHKGVPRVSPRHVASLSQ